MNLNNEIRKDIVKKLVAQATKKHAAAMGKAAESLHKLWRDLVIMALRRELPHLPQEHWASLIQCGTVNSISDLQVVKTKIVYAGTKNERVDAKASAPGYRERAFVGDQKTREQAMADYRLMIKALGENWSKFFNYFTSSSNDMGFRLMMKASFADLPYARFLKQADMRHFEPDFQLTPDNRAAVSWSNAAWPLVQKTDDLVDKFYQVAEEALAFQEMVTDLLASCKTAKQLEERFPEAAKFLPAPVLKRNEVIPTDVFNKARKMLEEGIPN